MKPFDDYLMKFLTKEIEFGCNGWFEHDGLSVYLRRKKYSMITPYDASSYTHQKGVLKDTVLDVGNLVVGVKGTGALTRFITQLETKVDRIYVESIQEPRLIGFFKKRGYIQVNRDYCTVNMYWEKS